MKTKSPTWPKGGEGLRGMSSRSGPAWQTSVIRTQLKKKKKTGLGDSALHSSRAKCGGGGELSRLLQQSLACGNGEGDGSQHVATAGRVWDNRMRGSGMKLALPCCACPLTSYVIRLPSHKWAVVTLSAARRKKKKVIRPPTRAFLNLISGASEPQWELREKIQSVLW